MVSKGYKPGGNSVGNNTNADGNPAFATKYDNETLWNYELGLKSELLEGRLRLNAAVFHLEWDDLQFESFFFLTPGDLSTNVDQIISIEDAEASGVEMEFAALVTDGLTISGGFGYLDTEVTSDTIVQLSGGWRPSLLGLDLPKSPELTANLVGEYRWSISGDNEAWVRLEYIHRDGQYSDMEGVTNRQLNGPSPNNAALIHNSGPNEFPYRSPDHDLLNLRAGVEWGAMEYYRLRAEPDRRKILYGYPGELWRQWYSIATQPAYYWRFDKLYLRWDLVSITDNSWLHFY